MVFVATKRSVVFTLLQQYSKICGFCISIYTKLVPFVRDFRVPPLKRLSISVDDATHVRLKVLAAESGTTMNAIVETAVKEHLFKYIDVAPNRAVNKPL